MRLVHRDTRGLSDQGDRLFRVVQNRLLGVVVGDPNSATLFVSAQMPSICEKTGTSHRPCLKAEAGNTFIRWSLCG